MVLGWLVINTKCLIIIIHPRKMDFSQVDVLQKQGVIQMVM